MDGMRKTLIEEVAGTCGPERIGRMHALAALPVKEGGLGHARISPLAPLAYLAGLVAASELAQLAEKREVIKTEVIWAHVRATEVLGGGEEVNRARLASPKFAEAFPADPEELYKNKRVLEPIADDNNSKNPSSGRQSMFKQILDKQGVKQFTSLIDPLKADDGPGSSFTSSLGINVDNENVQRPNRIFGVGMYRKEIRVKGTFFAAEVRRFFGMPSSCTHEVCVRVLGAGENQYRIELDQHGAHSSACHVGALKRLRVFIHNGLQRVVEAAGIKAVAHTRHEPTTTVLMRGRYTAADCRALFPASRRRPSYARSSIKRWTDTGTKGAWRQCSWCSGSSLSSPRKSSIPRGRAGRRWTRPDIVIGRQGDNGQELETWENVVGTNLISHAYVRHEFRRQQRVVAHVINPGPAAPSRIPIALREAESKKRNNYGPLLAAAQEHLAGEAQMQFLTFGFSLQGTLSPGAEEVIKCLKKTYDKRCERDPAPRDGATMK
jgi:hypothetical protein